MPAIAFVFPGAMIRSVESIASSFVSVSGAKKSRWRSCAW